MIEAKRLVVERGELGSGRLDEDRDEARAV